jgi:hypothetical protein
VEGVELTKLYSAVSAGKFSLNEPAMVSLTLECPDDDLITTEEDLNTIHEVRLSNSGGANLLVFPNHYKQKFLNRFAMMKILPEISRFKSENPGYSPSRRPDSRFDDYLYNYGVNGSVIPLGANVRVFIEYNGVWYYHFTGAVVSWSYTQTIEDHKFLTLRCMDPFYYLRRTSLVSQSMGAYESTLFKDILQALSKPGEPNPQPSTQSIGMATLATSDMSILKFNFNKRSFLDALAYAIFGDVDITQTGDARYGTVTTSQSARYFISEEDTEGAGDNVVRNVHASGMFNIENIAVGVFGKKKDDMVSKLKELNWGGFIPPQVNDLTDWEDITDNEVSYVDLFELSARDADGTRAILSDAGIEENDDFSNLSQENIVDIIGVNTRYDGMYSSSAGSLKVLLPGSLDKTSYDILWAEVFEMPSVDVFKVTPRLDVFAAFVTHRTDFVFYTTPKGHIVVEFPLIDNQSANCFGTLDEYGQPWRSYSKVDRTGAYSDQVNLDGLFSVASAMPYFGTLKTEYDKVPFYQPNPLDTQSSISYTLLQKIGVKVTRSDPIEGVIPTTVDAARLKADLILSRTNRGSYSGSVGMRFQPRNILNRNVEFWDVGRAGVVSLVNSSFIKDGLPSYSYTVSYIREWDGTYLQDGRRSYSVAYGELLTNIGIDYAAFFEEGMYSATVEETQVETTSAGVPPARRSEANRPYRYPPSDISRDPLRGLAGRDGRPPITGDVGDPRPGHTHEGVDLRAPIGTPIYATEGGKVTASGWGDGYGWRVRIEQPDGSFQVYGHMASDPSLSLPAGNTVGAGTQIGGVGSSGTSSGPHLHYEDYTPEEGYTNPFWL